jgi:hypothetical protein
MVARMSAAKVFLALIGVCGLLLAALSGCSTGHKQANANPPQQAVASTQPARPAAIDPMRLMQESLARCETLSGYEIVFHRQERRGLLGNLAEWEDIQVRYRKQPNSIKMVWLNADSEYAESVYVDGVNEGKVTVLPRKGLFGLPASPISVPPEMAVTMGKSLRPISDFGLAAILRRTLARIEEARQCGGATVTYEGVASVERLGTRAHHVVVCYPPGFPPTARQDLYINVETGYPDGTYLWLSSGDLRAAYLYEKPVVAIQADEMFVMVKKTPSLAEKD